MGKVVMYSSVSVDGFIADENDQPGPLFDWLLSGDVPLDESGELKVSQTSYDYTRPYWDQIGATVVGRHVFDMTDGWGGKPPGGVDHVVVVTHRPEPEGWDPEAPFHFVVWNSLARVKFCQAGVDLGQEHQSFDGVLERGVRREFVEDVLNLIEVDAHSEGIPVHIHLASGLPKVRADAVQLFELSGKRDQVRPVCHAGMLHKVITPRASRRSPPARRECESFCMRRPRRRIRA